MNENDIKGNFTTTTTKTTKSYPTTWSQLIKSNFTKANKMKLNVIVA